MLWNKLKMIVLLSIFFGNFISGINRQVQLRKVIFTSTKQFLLNFMGILIFTSLLSYSISFNIGILSFAALKFANCYQIEI